jgi:hypothetical protein
MMQRAHRIEDMREHRCAGTNRLLRDLKCRI